MIPADVLASIQSGDPLPAAALATYPLPEQEVAGDTGIHVLLDLAHHCYMGAMWGLAGQLKGGGFRCVSSHASLDTVLAPGRESMVRTLAGEAEDGKPVRPFVRWPNREANVVVTFQADGKAPAYTEAELVAIREFVARGGGLVVFADINAKGRCPAWGDYADWPLRQLTAVFGAEIEPDPVPFGAGTMPAFSPVGDDWKTIEIADSGEPIVLRRSFGKGRVVLAGSMWLVHHPLWTGTEQSDEEKALRAERLVDYVTWAAAGKPPVGGDLQLPDTHGGAGGIYPECERRFGGIHVLYAANQPPSVLQLVEEEYPKIRHRILAWLPSPVPEDEPLRILLGAGTGGGWAVNAFYPKENGIISYELAGVVGIFAHEFAHILSGPRNAAGEVAANWFDGNQGEAHAGFFQGRILASYTDNPSMRDCNKILEYEAENGPVDLGVAARDGYTGYGGGNTVWRKLWYVWQKLDDQYGTTWYPRWRWVQHTRWAVEPERKLTMTEMAEDMSIAVGADLFPFLRAVGTTLDRQDLGSIVFDGEELSLPVASLDTEPAGDARLEPCGDYRKPLAKDV